MTTPLDYGTQPGGRRTRPWVWVAAGLISAATFLLAGTLCAPPAATPDRVARGNIFVMEQGIDSFKEATGRYPTAEEGLGVLTGPTPSAPSWRGHYFGANLLRDPWGNSFVYTPPTGSSPPKVHSVGPDGINGTADDIASR